MCKHCRASKDHFKKLLLAMLRGSSSHEVGLLAPQHDMFVFLFTLFLFVYDGYILHINHSQMRTVGLCEDRIVHDHIPMHRRADACAELNELR